MLTPGVNFINILLAQNFGAKKLQSQTREKRKTLSYKNARKNVDEIDTRTAECN